MKLIQTVHKNYVNIDHISFIFTKPVEGHMKCFIFLITNKEYEISKDVYNFLINNYSL